MQRSWKQLFRMIVVLGKAKANELRFVSSGVTKAFMHIPSFAETSGCMCRNMYLDIDCQLEAYFGSYEPHAGPAFCVVSAALRYYLYALLLVRMLSCCVRWEADNKAVTDKKMTKFYYKVPHDDG